MPIPHADPGQRWLSLHDTRLRVGGEGSVLEVERPGQGRHGTNPGPPLEAADLRGDDRRRMTGGRGVGAVRGDASGGRRKLGRRLLHEPAGGVIEPDLQRQRRTGPDLCLGRHDLHPGWLARRPLRRVSDQLGGGLGLGVGCLMVLGDSRVAEAIQPRTGRQVDPPLPGDRRRRDLVLLDEPHPVDELQPVRRRFEHVPAARRADVEFALGHERAAANDRPEELHRLADGSTGRLVKDEDLGAVVHEIHPVAEHHRHRPAVHHPLLLPEDAGGGDVARADRLEGRRRAHRGVVEILLGLRHVDRVAGHERRDVEPAARELEVPDGLARPRLEVPDAAVARSEDQRRLAAEVRERRRAVGRVLGQLLRAVHPADRAGRGVETEEAVGRPGGVTPAGDDGAGDDQVVEHDRDVRPAAVGGEEAELFVQRPLPLRPAGRRVDRREHAAHAMREHGVGPRVGADSRPADPLGRDIGEIDVEHVLPELLSGAGVEAQHLLRLLLRARLVADEGVEFASHDHRRGDAAGRVALPEDVGVLARIECRGQAAARVLPVLPGAAPVGPFIG